VSTFCTKCGHKNQSEAFFCSSCGNALEVDGDKTIVIAKVDPLQDALGPQDNASVDLRTLPTGAATLMVRSGPQAGERFVLSSSITKLGRHPDEYVLRDSGSLNGTYVNQKPVESTVLQQGDEIQIGRFRLIYLGPSNES
jgi:hypothetical protein